MTAFAMTIDLDRCLGCEACMVACAAENEVPAGSSRMRMTTTVTGTFPDLASEFRVEQCLHCADAPCVDVCPTGATSKADDGTVLVDAAKCIGCKACVTACPYGMRYVHPDGWIDKCTFCDHRVAVGRVPACVETCPAGARAFGDLEDAGSPVSVALAAADTQAVLNPGANTRPRVVYLNADLGNRSDGLEPSTESL
jgi:Fe-S-cluster-containing dehydrogenase component